MTRGSTRISDLDDYYALLGIDANADGTQLRRAWRRLAVRWHPDRAGYAATATFQKIMAAYTVLSDPVARARYDRMRSGGAPGASSTAPGRRAPSVMLRRVSGHLKALLACGFARRAEGDVIELFLSTKEASDGGMVTIAMHVPVRCPACAADAAGSCAKCGSTRIIDELFSAWLAVPPGVGDGAVLKPSALLPGMVRPVSFRVRLQGVT